MRKDRAVSTTVGYVTTLGVMAILITGLLVAGGDFVADQRQGTIHTQMQVVGQHVVSDLDAADRLARDGSSVTLVMERSYPDRMTGATYTVAVEDAGGSQQRLVLASDDPEVTVEVTFDTRYDVRVDGGGVVPGGAVRIELDDVDGDGDDELVIYDA